MFAVGQKVIVTPKTKQELEFFEFIDGWDGVVAGINNGNVIVKCIRSDGVKTFFIPPDCLTAYAIK